MRGKKSKNILLWKFEEGFYELIKEFDFPAAQ